MGLFFGPNEVFEIRLLDVPSEWKGETSIKTVSGYGDGAGIGQCAKTVAAGWGRVASGIYFTPHSLLPSVLDRSRYTFSMRFGGESVSASDDDVIFRRFLIIDVDPVKPKGFKRQSATDGEKAAAAELVANVRTYLAGMGWTAPLVADSGNGFHLYYRLARPLAGGSVDSAGDEMACLLRVLKAKFDSPGAEIDPSVFNASRIMKIPGTPSRKGKPTPDRPHRMSGVLEVPADWRSPPQKGDEADDLICRTINDLDPNGTLRLPKGGKGKAQPASPAASLPLDNLPPLERRIARARKHLAKIPAAIEGSNGSKPTLYAARVLVRGYLLDSQTALGLLLSDYNPRCEPQWSESQLAHKIHDAETKPFSKPAGWCLAALRDRLPNLAAQVEPSTAAELFSGPTAVGGDAHAKSPAPDQPYLNDAEDDPHRLARAVLAGYQSNGRRTLVYWRGNFHEWRGAGYRTRAESEFRATLNDVIYREVAKTHQLRLKQHDASTGAEPPKMPKVTKPVVENVIAALQGMCLLPDSTEAPAWISGVGPDPRSIVATVGGLIYLPDYAKGLASGVIANTPDYFNFNALSFSVSHADSQADGWSKFLASIDPDEGESISLLQEWFGYFLVPDTRQQKMLLMVGPPRSGKGTINKVLRHLLGEANCANPTLGSLSRPYGLASLVGKLVAIAEDVRLDPKGSVQELMERLLTISGGGRIEVDRKHRDPITCELKARLVFAGNLPPQLTDSTGAMANRWSVLRFTKSFLHKEDTGLSDRLLLELPGIFNWAVEGWRRLQQNGHFSKPESAAELVASIAEESNALREFGDSYLFSAFSAGLSGFPIRLL